MSRAQQDLPHGVGAGSSCRHSKTSAAGEMLRRSARRFYAQPVSRSRRGTSQSPKASTRRPRQQSRGSGAPETSNLVSLLRAGGDASRASRGLRRRRKDGVGRDPKANCCAQCLLKADSSRCAACHTSPQLEGAELHAPGVYRREVARQSLGTLGMRSPILCREGCCREK